MRKDYKLFLFNLKTFIMIKYSLGIDVSYKKFDVCLSTIDQDQSIRIVATRQFINTPVGFKKLIEWLYSQQRDKQIPLVICMEATGIYYEQLALFLSDKRYSVAVVLPNKAKKYLQSIGLKSKNDKIDAKGLAQMGAQQKLELWSPFGKYFYELRALTRQLQSIQELKTVANNQLHASKLAMFELKFVLKQQQKLIKEYDKMINDLAIKIEKHLKSDIEIMNKIGKIMKIKGVGLLTVAILLAETNGFELFTSASQLTSYAGYDVVENQSGNRTGRTRISKKGNSRIRRILHLPAFNVVRYKEPIFENLFFRILERSNKKMVGYVAVQKKLLLIIFALWKNNTDYNQLINCNKNTEMEYV